MSGPGLSDFQIELAHVFFSVPESAGFLLAGGGALIAQGIVSRPTEDLDFFTDRRVGDVEAASDALITAVVARGWTAELLRSGPGFRRWAITGSETVLVDLAVDSPATGTPSLTIAGPALDPADLVVRKTLALFGRAEPRDYVDVYVLHQRFNRDDTLHAAAESDPASTGTSSCEPSAPTDGSAIRISPTSAHLLRRSAATSTPGPPSSTRVEPSGRHHQLHHHVGRGLPPTGAHPICHSSQPGTLRP